MTFFLLQKVRYMGISQQAIFFLQQQQDTIESTLDEMMLT